jgi:hypothetical protein
MIRAWIVGVAAALLAGSAFAQAIDYGRLQHSTLEALVANLDAGVAKDKGHIPKVGDRIFDGALSGWVVEAGYTSAVSPMSDDEKAFLRDGFKSIQQEPLAALYDKSMLFHVGGKDYWLPVQSDVIPYFAKELKVGDKVDLYILQTGGLLRKTGWEWVFMVVDFQKPK